jgi:hypothetical protein
MAMSWVAAAAVRTRRRAKRSAGVRVGSTSGIVTDTAATTAIAPATQVRRSPKRWTRGDHRTFREKGSSSRRSPPMERSETPWSRR